jgi:hypothetical protein
VTLRIDHISGAAAILTGIVVFTISGELPVGSLSFPGAGMMPKLLCGLMILFGAVLIARAGASKPFSEIGWNDLPHALIVFAIAFAAVAFYTTLGFIISMALMLTALVAFERQPLHYAALYGICVSISSYVLFTMVLKSPLERGLFGF